MSTNSLQCGIAHGQGRAHRSRFLITLDVGIGDAIAIGLCAIEQILENDPLAWGAIDVLCNELQAHIFACDPRIRQVIVTNTVFFPGAHIRQWLRGLLLDAEAKRIVRFLKQKQYEAVLPCTVAPGLYFRLRSHIMYPHLFELANRFLNAHKRMDLHESLVVRHMVDCYFQKSLWSAPQDTDIHLYLPLPALQRAQETITRLKRAAPVEERCCKVLVTAPDTASAVTRPPLELLIEAFSAALRAQPDLIIAVLPSYTETTRSLHLSQALCTNYPQRVFLLPAEPKAHLLDTAAFIDQADIFVSGDTGIMHLAAARKVGIERDNSLLAPRNKVKLIALFGGTNPGYYGYRKRTTIIGWGRKEQEALRPGFFKGAYRMKKPHLFDHISPQQITDAILASSAS